MSAKLAARLCDRMLLSPSERRRIFSGDGLDGLETKLEYVQLSADQFHVISEWQHFALLNLIKLPKQKLDISSIAARLGVPKTEVQRMVARLQRLGLVRQNGSKLVRTHTRMQTSDGVRDVSVQQSHFNFLELAAKKLRESPMEMRDFTTMTMGINSKKLPEAKKLIREFQDRLSELLEDDNADEVFVFGTQLIPVTQENV